MTSENHEHSCSASACTSSVQMHFASESLMMATPQLVTEMSMEVTTSRGVRGPILAGTGAILSLMD